MRGRDVTKLAEPVVIDVFRIFISSKELVADKVILRQCTNLLANRQNQLSVCLHLLPPVSSHVKFI